MNSFRLASLCLLVAFHPATVSAADLLIENVTVLSPERSRPLPKQHVLIRDNRIIAIRGRSIATDSVVRIDGTGKFLTPGLMDSHVHVSAVAGLALGDSTSEPLARAYQRQQPRSYLYFGVTQLLDLNNTPEGIATFEAQPVRPDLFRCGGAPVLNGYPSVFVEPPARYRLMPNFIYEPANRDALPAGFDPTAHAPEAVVARIAYSGAKCVKIFIEDGFGPATHWPILSIETIKRVRREAHRRGLFVVAHANALDMQRIALASRVDVIAHGLWNWTDVEDSSDAIPEVIAAHLREIHRNKIAWQPTLRVLAGTAELFMPETLNDPLFAKVVPHELLTWYRSVEGQWFKRELQRDFDNAPDATIAKSQSRGVNRNLRATQYLHQLGHPLLLASDTPSSPTYGNQPGYDTYREIQLMAQADIPLETIFAAATINNARQFGLERDYGTVQVGKIANLLLLDTNPLLSVDAWNRIDKVILRGKPLARASLAADSTQVPEVKSRPNS